ncbi:hypothetical protein EIP91_007338 [Steccherinum ochraceum]|uniref:Transglycosylase SLT domain-containing protein n=1 Tax=Steccherinum ochraceum TaxID=92696 RepID=A0A4R0RRZ2_9APHY|nr:hypothetical protein EIP91_007338 [Steccherinum ochraceum]
MKLTTPFIILAAALGVAEASLQGHRAGLSRISSHHNIRARNEVRAVDSTNTTSKRAQRCKPRPSSSSPAAQSTTSQAPEPSKTPEPTKAPASSKAPESSKAPQSTKAPAPPPSSGVSGLIKVTSSQCGASGATKESSAQDGPNGKLDWLNCGIDAGGWNPPNVTPGDLITKDLADAVNEKNSPFANCKPYLSSFENYANQHGIPPILIASIAMQESGCNAGATGGAGEQGLMQITKDKCGGAPGGNCKDPDFNIRTGVSYFAETLKSNNNNVVKTLGNYNGWSQGLTVAKATAAAHTSCCRCQNNLDYLQQTFNGWILGIDPIAAGFGKYHNLDVCN